MSATVMIEFQQVSKSYGTVEVLKDFNLKIFSGEFITVIGSSGCGKTTALKLINGLIPPDEGKIFVNQKDINQIDQNQLRRHIGYVIQNIGLFPHMTIGENIAYVPKLLKTDNQAILARTRELLDIMGLEQAMAKRYPAELSGGQKQRVGIARALAAKPEILLMDEPFGAVDEITRKSLQEEISTIQKNADLTVFFITHAIDEALKLGSRVVVMDKGHIQQIDSPEQIQATPANEFVKKLLG